MNRVILTLMNIPGVGSETVRHIIKYINRETGDLDYKELLNMAMIKNRKLEIPEGNVIREASDAADRIIEESLKRKINVINMESPEYPESLKDILRPPLILFYRGNISSLSKKKTIGIVGTRKPSYHGMRISRRLGYIFARDNYTVISGLAAGCDSYAHIGCIEGQGTTVAVMPCSLDQVYPLSNARLYCEILWNNGCVVSEYPIGSRVCKGNFVRRDRIESGLSHGVIIVETGQNGGAMRTANYSIKEGKPLACYMGGSPMDGNIILTNSGKALSISNSKELMEFRNMIY